MEKGITLKYHTTKSERSSYWLYYLGQNLFWFVSGLTFTGVAALAMLPETNDSTSSATKMYRSWRNTIMAK